MLLCFCNYIIYMPSLTVSLLHEPVFYHNATHPPNHSHLSPLKVNSLWPPCVADADVIFLPCGFFFLLFFLSSPNLSRRRLDVYHTFTHGVALVRI